MTSGDILSKIEDKISEADSLVLILSPESMNSKWVHRELSMAREKNLKIFPLLLNDVKLPANLENVKYLKLDDSYDKTVLALEEALRKSA